MLQLIIKNINLKKVLKANMFLTSNDIDNKENKENNERDKHIFFLENLLTKLKNNQLSHTEKREISEFYLKNMFFNNENEIDEKKIYKYLYMGWYIYEFLICDNK